MIILRGYKSVVSSVILTTFISLHCFTSIRCSDDYTKEIENQNEINNKNNIDDIIKEMEGKHTWTIFEITIEIKKNDFPRLKEDFKNGLKNFMHQSYRIDDDKKLYEGTTSKNNTKSYMLRNKKDAENIANSIKENEDEKEVKEGKENHENNEIVKIPFYILVEDISTYNIDNNQYDVNAKTKNHFKTLDNYCVKNGFTYSIKIFAADTSDVTNISFIFSECKALTKIEGLEEWDTSKVKDMSGMFDGCKNLVIKTSKWNDNIKRILSQDYEKYSITLDVSKMDINEITNMNNMFSGYKVLTEIVGLDIWDTSKVKDMSSMFSGCSSLKSLPDLSKWHTQNVTDMSYMFDECSSLSSLPNISKWDTKNVTNMKGMFYCCTLLESLPDISNWDTSNVINMSFMFCECNKLESLPKISNWNTGNVKDMSYMFYNCGSLLSLPDISNWKAGNVKNMSYMFYECTKLKNIPDKFKQVS